MSQEREIGFWSSHKTMMGDDFPLAGDRPAVAVNRERVLIRSHSECLGTVSDREWVYDRKTGRFSDRSVVRNNALGIADSNGSPLGDADQRKFVDWFGGWVRRKTQAFVAGLTANTPHLLEAAFADLALAARIHEEMRIGPPGTASSPGGPIPEM